MLGGAVMAVQVQSYDIWAAISFAKRTDDQAFSAEDSAKLPTTTGLVKEYLQSW